MAKEKYIAPTTSVRTLESTTSILKSSTSAEGSGGSTTTDPLNPFGVKEERYDFSEPVFNDNPWQE